MNTPPHLDLLNVILPIVVAGLFIAALSLMREPNRRHLSALFIAGAGATYFGGSFGFWEVGFCALLTWLAFKALTNYRFAGLGWLLHSAWDLLHHLYGRPILPFVPLSSAGCAICDAGIAIWYFLGAPSVFGRSNSDLGDSQPNLNSD
jgi:hypothetical protein